MARKPDPDRDSKPGYGTVWTTADEKQWLREIGDELGRHWSKPVPDKRTLLAGYLEQAGRRYDWGEIDKGAAVAEAQRLLNQAI